jgi:hypothetical protein
MSYTMIPRGLYFNHEGLCVGTGYTRKKTDPPFKRVIVHLPFDRSEFELIGSSVVTSKDLVDVKGKTLEEIKAEVKKFIR